ncbi:MAG: glycosyl hydrolase family 65 protein [Sellimonas intestinalis]
MPKEWSSLTFRLHYDNAWLEIRTDGNNQAEVRRLDGAPVGIWINGEKKRFRREPR